MTAVETATTSLTEEQLGLLYQYTMEAYKTFQKFAEMLQNPLAATMFKQFAVDERDDRDLLEMKVASLGGKRGARATLGADLQFSDILEGDLSYRESAEFLIARERTMARRVEELAKRAAPADQNLLIYLLAVKRSHVVALERELALIRNDSAWWKREDVESRIIHGTRGE